ncbi:MAG: hypothetical protein COB02_01520 [Candidatus Cloacimonadota bacterium]|nr:MAG: hypothetical protein COB02_01520 [Candidatus Cloacimonadota bacterium]
MVGIKPKLKYKNTEALYRKKRAKFVTVLASLIVLFLILSSVYLLYQSYLNAAQLIQEKPNNISIINKIKATIKPKINITLLDNSKNHISIYIPIEQSALLELKKFSLKGQSQKIQNIKLIQIILKKLLQSQKISVKNSFFNESIRSIFYYKKTLIIDFHLKVLDLFNKEGLKPIILHYAFVNSVLENFPVNKLKFLFDGETPKQSESIIDYSTKFQTNKDLIK